MILTTIRIITHEASGTYHARAVGYGLTATCTSDARYAAERVALKAKSFPAKPKDNKQPFAQSGITLTQVTPTLYKATWEL